MKKRPLLFPCILLFSTHTLYAILQALLIFFNADVVLSATIFTDAFDLLSRYAEFFGSMFLFTLIVFFIYRYGTSCSVSLFVVGFFSLAYKYLATIIAVSIVRGSIDLTGSLWSDLLFFFIEVLLAALVALLAHKLITRRKRNYEARKRAAATLGEAFEESDGCYPFARFGRVKGPVAFTLFVGALLLTILHAVSFLVFFITGAPVFKEDILPLIIYTFLFSILPGGLSYFIGRWLFTSRMKRSK